MSKANDVEITRELSEAEFDAVSGGVIKALRRGSEIEDPRQFGEWITDVERQK